MPLLQRTAPLKAGREQNSPAPHPHGRASDSPTSFLSISSSTLPSSQAELTAASPVCPLLSHILAFAHADGAAWSPFPPMLQGPPPPPAWPVSPAGTGLLCLVSDSLLTLSGGLLGEPPLAGTEHLRHSIATQFFFVHPSTIPSMVPRVLQEVDTGLLGQLIIELNNS